MAYSFIATPASKDRYHLHIEGSATTLAAVQQAESGAWRTELLSAHFGIERDAIDAFPDQPTAVAALRQLVGWANDRLIIKEWAAAPVVRRRAYGSPKEGRA